MIVGDSPQALVAKLSPAEAAKFLANRQMMGFNSVWVNCYATDTRAEDRMGRRTTRSLRSLLPETFRLPMRLTSAALIP